jgi:hypothetical protein
MPTTKPKYSSYIKDMPFLYLEMRKAAKLIYQGETPESIVSLSVEQNIFQLTKEIRRLKLAQKVVARLAAVERPIVELIANGSDENARLGAFYALIKTDLLFFEFMREIYCDRVSIGQSIITDSEIASFLAYKTGENERMATWTANNLIRVKNTYKIILCEAGLTKRDNANLMITKPIPADELRAAWSKPDVYTRAMCVEV